MMNSGYRIKLDIDSLECAECAMTFIQMAEDEWTRLRNMEILKGKNVNYYLYEVADRINAISRNYRQRAGAADGQWYLARCAADADEVEEVADEVKKSLSQMVLQHMPYCWQPFVVSMAMCQTYIHGAELMRKSMSSEKRSVLMDIHQLMGEMTDRLKIPQWKDLDFDVTPLGLKVIDRLTEVVKAHRQEDGYHAVMSKTSLDTRLEAKDIKNICDRIVNKKIK